ncbi:MAG TPA: aspartate--tRNA(Asn) ligase [Petrotogaceae bacterium]|nr:aspartate--tRNA(Asn) ligase [Petrotogaceae bacterium]HQI79235.1 aspartate--tRNA(Asn) ligase [Petrotogaceae bacterium]
MRQRIKELLGLKSETQVCICGFIKTVRNKGKNLKFMIIDDGSSQIQATFLRTLLGEKMDVLDKISVNSVLKISGTINRTELSKSGTEVLVTDLEVLSSAHTGLPIDISEELESSLEKRLNWRHLDLRNPKKKLIFRIFSDFLKLSREYFYARHLTEISSSKLMAAASESGAQVFQVNYFERKAFLAQSPQFYKQMAIAGGFEGVFEIGPVFRAEPSFTSRHTTEFTSLDVEIAYVETVEDVMCFEEQWLAFTFSGLKELYSKQLEELYGIQINIPELPFPRISMTQAQAIVKNYGIECLENSDLSSDGEKALGRYVKEVFNSDFVFLTDFPWSVRPFYHMRSENKQITKSFDLIYCGTEITTGAQREHRYDILCSQASEKLPDLNGIEDYLNFFKYGCPPHGGFGLSPARVITCMLGLDNIREATLLPRDPKRLTP